MTVDLHRLARKVVLPEVFGKARPAVPRDLARASFPTNPAPQVGEGPPLEARKARPLEAEYTSGHGLE